MILLLTFAFLAGAATAITPCVLPVLARVMWVRGVPVAGQYLECARVLVHVVQVDEHGHVAEVVAMLTELVREERSQALEHRAGGGRTGGVAGR